MENAVLLARAETPSIPSQGLRNLVMWGGPIFLSAFLLFQVQPLLAKIILPWFGGGAGVWITTLVFFQIAYLLGNLYAYWLGAKTKAITNVPMRTTISTRPPGFCSIARECPRQAPMTIQHCLTGAAPTW